MRLDCTEKRPSSNRSFKREAREIALGAGTRMKKRRRKRRMRVISASLFVAVGFCV